MWRVAELLGVSPRDRLALRRKVLGREGSGADDDAADAHEARS